eukprot:CAMPEP_0176423988 /NCGR_PEP_ID=MMETSP0127-20121128/10593_1 /TAXON_ID=938130 /ORGANISM="Platyophrya macrostoma, Strain WH" /LENGTH=220 /DNA_ID=CAMNT_0017805007 /DNA_START=168 /DNA_END=830 /DNA_ORIENTATION=+
MRQGIEALNSVTNLDTQNQLIRAALECSSSARTDSQVSGGATAPEIALLTLRFIVSQLAFFGLSDPSRISELLASSVTTPYHSEPCQLSEAWQQVVMDAWLVDGKGIVQRQRDAAVTNLCQTPADPSDRALLVQASVEVCSGYAIETNPEVYEDPMHVEYELQQNHHRPVALVSLPPTQSNASRTALTLSLEDAYTMFCAIDTIQTAIDKMSTGSSIACQ